MLLCSPNARAFPAVSLETVPGKPMTEAQLAEHRVTAHAWYLERYISGTKVPIEVLANLAEPPPEIQRRMIPEHVANISDSMYIHKTKPPESDIVLAFHLAEAASASARRQLVYDAKLAAASFALGGQHAAGALCVQQQRNDKESDGGMWHRPQPVGLIPYNAESENDMQMLRTISVQLNKAREVFRAETFGEDLVRSRALMMRIIEEQELGPFVDGDSLPPNVRKFIQSRMTCPANARMDRWRVVQMPAEIWAVLLPYFVVGERRPGVKKKIANAPGSGAAFAVTTGIPYPFLLIWCRALVRGSWSGQTFLRKTKEYKKKICVKTLTLQFLSVMDFFGVVGDEVTEIHDIWKTLNLFPVGKTRKRVSKKAQQKQQEEDEGPRVDIAGIWNKLCKKWPAFAQPSFLDTWFHTLERHNYRAQQLMTPAWKMQIEQFVNKGAVKPVSELPHASLLFSASVVSFDLTCLASFLQSVSAKDVTVTEIKLGNATVTAIHGDANFSATAIKRGSYGK